MKYSLINRINVKISKISTLIKLKNVMFTNCVFVINLINFGILTVTKKGHYTKRYIVSAYL